MKKQFVLIALAAGAIMMAAPKAFAADAQDITTDHSGGPGGGGANVFTVTGTIPEFVQITAVDNVLELGDLGGPQATGAITTTTRAQQANGGNLTKGTSAVNNGSIDDGTAQVQLQSNTYVSVSTTLPTVVTNSTPFTGTVPGPGVVAATTIPVGFRVAVKGKIYFSDTTDPYTVYPTSNFNVDSQGYATFSPILPTGGPFSMTFAPYGGSTGAGVTSPSTAAPSGFKVAAVLSRNGLNDLRGTYGTTIPLSYTKF